ncbi:phosphoesterase, partial [Burkholderia pseudomallei]
GRRVPFFTVPGNHEYFTGAVSFLHALDSGELVDTPAQRRRSCNARDSRCRGRGTASRRPRCAGRNNWLAAAAAQQATLERLHIGRVETAGEGASPHWPTDRNPYFRHASLADLPVRDTTSPVDQVTVRTDEAVWHLDKLASFPGRSILLSHHQLYSAHVE